MNKIKLLPPHEAQKIAAGEVVDRPSNIVKELMENALDAQSSRISLYLEDGGKKSIRIKDNGHGMSAEDAKTALLRHSTSKIESIEDLQTIATYGFRGEALASIIAVSKTTLITKTSEGLQATKLIIEAGKITTEEPCAHGVGTSITVGDLFFNVPARKKFLRTAATEARAITQLVYAFALSHPHIHIKFYNDGNLTYHCGPTEKASERMCQLSANLKINDLLEIKKTTEHGITVSGFASHHHIARYDRNNIFFFVNGRAIKLYKLANAFIKGYQNALPPQKYPVGAIFITMNPQEVDVNIHPRKEEVAFLHPRKVEQLITQAIQKTLENEIKKLYTPADHNQPQAPRSYFMPEVSIVSPSGTSRNTAFLNRPPVKELDQPEDDGLFFPLPQQFIMPQKIEIPSTQSTPAKHISVQQELTPKTHATRGYSLIGQLMKTYILIENETGLMMVDQHAAHERVLYEQFGSKFNKHEATALLFPSIIELSSQEISQLEPCLEMLHAYGIIIEPFGPQKVMLSATPAGLQNINYQEFLRSILSLLDEDRSVDERDIQKKLSHHMRAMMACKAAVKAGDILTQEKMFEILDQLMGIDNMLTCPHGRPTTWRIDGADIEKKFKRRSGFKEI